MTLTITSDLNTLARAYFDAKELIGQIGSNLMAISGGRVLCYENGIELPCGGGYRVIITLAANDTWTVRRCYKRGLKLSDKGTMRNVPACMVGEVAYQAHAFRSGSFGE